MFFRTGILYNCIQFYIIEGYHVIYNNSNVKTDQSEQLSLFFFFEKTKKKRAVACRSKQGHKMGKAEK